MRKTPGAQNGTVLPLRSTKWYCAPTQEHKIVLCGSIRCTGTLYLSVVVAVVQHARTYELTFTLAGSEDLHVRTELGKQTKLRSAKTGGSGSCYFYYYLLLPLPTTTYYLLLPLPTTIT